MSLLSLFGRSHTPQRDMLVPQAVDPNELSEEKMKRDLEKLNEFQNKIAEKKAILDAPVADLKPEEAALKLKNPFRGK